MKIIKYIIWIVLPILFAACTEEGRIDQVDSSDRIPSQVTIRDVESIAGGAIIRFECPDDDYIYGVKVVYDRNGETCEYMVSRYSNTLRVEGLSSSEPRQVEVVSVGKNLKTSDPLRVEITPGPPAVQTVQFEFSETFGGVKINLSGNDYLSDLAVVLLRDTVWTDEGKPLNEIDWEELSTFHTSSSQVAMVQRNLPDEPCLFAVFARDRWGNLSDTLSAILTPLIEYELPRVGKWQLYPLPGDETVPLEYPNGLYTLDHLFDGKWNVNGDCMGFSAGKRDRWVTIDLGFTASLSRHSLKQRLSVGIDEQMPWQWQIWGSMNPNPDGSYDESWYLLGDFVTYKPSGVLPDGSGPGTFTNEDFQWIKFTNEYDFEETEKVSDPHRECRYIRLRCRNDRTSYYTVYDDEPSNIRYIIGELILWGSQVN